MRTDMQTGETAPRGLVIAAFAAIYILWGSTYLGIRIAIETLPPFLMAGSRFVLAGLILYAIRRWKGAKPIETRHWFRAGLIAFFMIAIGNGGVTWAEQRIPSGLACLLVAITPFWIALFDGLRPNGVKPSLRTIIGLIVGFSGVVVLVGSNRVMNAGPIDPTGALVLLLSSMGWSTGTLVSRYSAKPSDPLAGVAAQMILGGLLLTIMSFGSGEYKVLNPGAITARSVAACLYLVVFGSLIGYTAYNWLLTVSTPARASTCSYVNPAIAVFLGWAFAGEPLTPQVFFASAVIILGVILITTQPPAVARIIIQPERT